MVMKEVVGVTVTPRVSRFVLCASPLRQENSHLIRHAAQFPIHTQPAGMPEQRSPWMRNGSVLTKKEACVTEW